MTQPAPSPPARTESQRRLSWRLDRAALEFDTGVLELLAARRPDDLGVLVPLAQAYARLKRHRNGLAIDRRLVATRPKEPGFRYNLACSLALTGDLDGACGELLAAIDLGYRNFDHLRRDGDLRSLRKDRRYALIRDRMDEVGDDVATP